ncbi:MAG: OmpH family outer membrane protein [Neisseria sp.]|nr:OmpH family outer membrane protein [Neisseria sp.]
MRMTLWWRAMMCAGILAISMPLYAKCDCPKLGFIDTERIYRETDQAQAINDALQREFAERRAALTRQEEAGAALSKEIAATQNSKKRARLQKRLEQMQQQYAVAQRQFIEDYSLRRNEEFSALQLRANRVLSEFRQREGYDWIDDGAVLVDKKYDITDEIIKALNGDTQ